MQALQALQAQPFSCILMRHHYSAIAINLHIATDYPLEANTQVTPCKHSSLLLIQTPTLDWLLVTNLRFFALRLGPIPTSIPPHYFALDS